MVKSDYTWHNFAAVSNLNHLLEQYRQSAQTTQLHEALRQPRPRIELTGLRGAQCAFAVAATVAATAPPVLFIAEAKESAAYLHNDLTSLLGPDLAFFFPDSFKRPAYFEDLNQTQVLQRAETVNKITRPGFAGGVVVTYPEALFEKVVSPEVLAQSRIDLNTGERMDVDFLLETLIEYGFERADFVYEPGQFSLRGGIIDLFSWGNDLPYRIELFDDEVERIRIFDPLTQLSKETMSHVSIVPNLSTRFRQDQKVSLLQILPAETPIWARDFQALLDRLQSCFDKAQDFAAKLTALDAAELREIFRDRAFTYPGDVLESVMERPLIFLENTNLLRKNHPGIF